MRSLPRLSVSAVLPTDWPLIEDSAKKAVKEKQAFERVVMPKEALLEMFAVRRVPSSTLARRLTPPSPWSLPLYVPQYNKYKTHFIQTQVPDGTSSTVYRCGPLIDFCAGPHITNTSKIKAFSVTKASSSYFMGDAKNDSLQRVYGISFPDTKQMTEYKHWLQEAEKRNHRRIGIDQELFTFHDLSPGSPIFLPNGMKIYNALMDLIREEYHERNYQEGASLCSPSERSGLLARASQADAQPPPLFPLRAPSHVAHDVQRRPVEAVWPLCQLQGRHVYAQRRRGRVCAQADELPGSLPHL
jgi:hypothetical protein